MMRPARNCNRFRASLSARGDRVLYTTIRVRARIPGGSFGSSPRAFDTPGAGGSFAFADPDARLGYAYVMNKTDFYMIDDPREKGASRRHLPRDGGARSRRRASARARAARGSSPALNLDGSAGAPPEMRYGGGDCTFMRVTTADAIV